MSSASSVRIRQVLTHVAGDELDDALCDWFADLFRGDDRLGVDVEFASESLSSFLPRFPSPGSVEAREIAAEAIAAATGKAAKAKSDEKNAATPSAMLTSLAELTCAGASSSSEPAVVPSVDGSAGHSSESEEDATNATDAAANALRDLFPGAKNRTLALAITRAHGDIGAAAQYILDAGGLQVLDAEAAEISRQRKCAAEAEARASRVAIVSRFGEAPDDASVTHRPKAPAVSKSGKERVLRYVDGVPVHLAAREKFIVEKPPEADPKTFVALKISKKGSGGPSPGFKK